MAEFWNPTRRARAGIGPSHHADTLVTTGHPALTLVTRS